MDRVIHMGGAMLMRKSDLLHRIGSGEHGFASVNFTVHYKDFPLKNKLHLYKSPRESGNDKVIQEGFQDQV